MASKRNPILDGPYNSKRNAEIAKDNLSYSYGGTLKTKKTSKGWFVITPTEFKESRTKKHNPKYVIVHLPGVKNPVMGILNPFYDLTLEERRILSAIKSTGPGVFRKESDIKIAKALVRKKYLRLDKEGYFIFTKKGKEESRVL